MIPVSLDPEEFQRLIERFAAELPEILAGHHLCADLARHTERLPAMFDTPFTIAIVGRMRTGKSSLINALIGADLAVIGVNETTATINWFRHGGPDSAATFRAVWKDRPAETFPLAELHRWVGDSQCARVTKSLEFFAAVPFLRSANVVDTPGTRSVLEAHTAATEEFLAIRCERDTQAAGDSADAVVYVLPPVARESDQDLLEAFERTSRIPGSSPYNSLAVVHKWETQESDDPYENALRKCERVRKAIGGLVADVFPVSAPLGRAAERFGADFWEAMFALYETPQVALSDLLMQEKDFMNWEEPACPLSVAARRSLRTDYELPWASFKAVAAIAKRRKPADPNELRALIAEAGGISKLRELLERRFLTRSRLIKVFGVLAKAREPCQVALVRLRNHKVRQTALLEEAERAIGPLTAAVHSGAGDLEPALRYLRETRQTVEREARDTAESLRRLGEASIAVNDAFDDLDNDMKMLELLDRLEVESEWRGTLRSLFGADGTGLSQRLSGTDGTLAAVDDLLGKVRAQALKSRPEFKKLFDHARTRLQQIADALDR